MSSIEPTSEVECISTNNENIIMYHFRLLHSRGHGPFFAVTVGPRQEQFENVN